MATDDLVRVKDMTALRNTLNANLLENAVFIHKIFESGLRFRCYSDPEHKVLVAVEEKGDNVLFAGAWKDIKLPVDQLPASGFFTSACPPATLAKIGDHFEIKEDWPCWRYLAPEGYGPGPWNELDRLSEKDVPFIARYWDLIDDPEDVLREKVMKYESACVRDGGVLVSWAGLHFEIDGVGEMGFAHTLEDHRRKGHAKLVVKALVNRIASHGNKAFCHMFKSNRESIGLCEHMGFDRCGEATWARIGARL